MSESESGAVETGGTARIHPPTLAGLLLLGGLVLHLLGHHPHHPLVDPHQLVGLLIVAGGVALTVYAAALFAARATTKNPYGDPTSFVVVMPYTFTRNPMYLGLAALLVGFAVFFASFAILLAAVIFFVVIDRTVIPQEEQTMERLFGQQYLDYKIRVRRWL
jgi:protein-S-isoprenylcysteine O-methyltransferase Ste14